MRKIWKFPLINIGSNYISPPAGAEFRYLDWDPSGAGAPAVWYEVDTDIAAGQAPKSVRVVQVGTGHDIEPGGQYLGSLTQMATFVWHFYAYPAP